MHLKSKYETHVLPYLEKIEKWAMSGATAKEIAEKLHVAYSTFRKYLDEGEKGDERYAALSAAFVQACEEPDDEVEAALHKRACGISYDECTYESKWSEAEQDFVEVCTKRVRKYVPPDPTSAMFWLTNRRADKWKYKPEPMEKEDDDGGVVVLAPVMENPGPPTHEDKANE